MLRGSIALWGRGCTDFGRPMGESIQYQLHAIRNAQLVIGMQERLFYRVLLDTELLGDLAIAIPSATRFTICSSRGVSMPSPFALMMRVPGTELSASMT